MGLTDNKLRQSLSGLDRVRIGCVDPDKFPTLLIAPPIHRHAANHASLGIFASCIKSLSDEDPDLINECVALAVSINDFAPHDWGLVIENEPHNLHVKLHSLRHSNG